MSNWSDSIDVPGALVSEKLAHSLNKVAPKIVSSLEEENVVLDDNRDDEEGDVSLNLDFFFFCLPKLLMLDKIHDSFRMRVRGSYDFESIFAFYS